MKQIKNKKIPSNERIKTILDTKLMLVVFLGLMGCIALYGYNTMKINNKTTFTSTAEQDIRIPTTSPQAKTFLLPTRSIEKDKMTVKTGDFFRLTYPATWYEYAYGRGLPPNTIEVFEVHNTPQFEDDENIPNVWLTVEVNEKPETLTQKEALIIQLNNEYVKVSKTGYHINRELLQNNPVLVWERLETDRYEKKYYLVKDKGYFLSFTIIIPNGFSSLDVKNFYIEDLNRILSSFHFI